MAEPLCTVGGERGGFHPNISQWCYLMGTTEWRGCRWTVHIRRTNMKVGSHTIGNIFLAAPLPDPAEV